METKLTKGPWTLGTEELAGDGLKVFGASGINVGWTSAVRSRGGVVIDPHCRIEAEEAKANAALIAAAPELYEALERLSAYLDIPEDENFAEIEESIEFKAARAALAKARGERS